MVISERLKTIADTIAHQTIADIGCDHGYTAIYAVLSAKAKYAFACDINEGPLFRAADNVRKHGVADKVAILRGPGLAPLEGTDVETVIITGIGGYLTIDILNEGLKYIPKVKQLILQPMSEIPKVRRFLHGAGFIITDEQMIFTDDKFYNIINGAPGTGQAYSEAEYEYGRACTQKNPDLFDKYIKMETNKIRAIIKNIDAGAAAIKARERRRELSNKLTLLKQTEAGNARAN